MNTVPFLYLIDHDAKFCLLVRLLIKRYLPNCQLRCFSSGQALLADILLTDHLPDLILFDLHVPDSYSTLRILKQHERYQDVPVLLMSAKANPHDAVACYQAGAQSFVRKSVELDELKSFIGFIGQQYCQLHK